MQTFAIIGTGAIGGYCAIKLQQAGYKVHCLVHSDYALVKQQGLTLIEKDIPTTFAINTYNDVKTMPVCDVILVALKTNHNQLLKTMLPLLMHDKSVVVLLQNGIGMEKELAEFIAPKKIMGASCLLKVSKDQPGVITHFGFNRIDLAQYYSDDKKTGISPVVNELMTIFEQAGFIATAHEHLPTIRWQKLTSNIANSGLSVVLNASLQQMVNHPASYNLLWTLNKEVIAAAIGCGAHINQDFYEFRRGVIESYKTIPESYPSMKIDFDLKRSLELHAIYENAINIAQTNDISMPYTEMLYQQLVYLNEMNLR